MLEDFRIAPLNGKAPTRAVIFLHGLGDRGDGGLLSIGQMWQATMPDCEFLCPNAPFTFEGAPEDFGGRQWFTLQSFSEEEILNGAKRATPLLNEYIDHVLATRKLTPDRLALVGFSQGTIMALYAAPRRAPPVACIVGYSGLLIGGQTLAAEKKSSPPVLLVHGMMDEVVPYGAMAAAEDGLKAAGIPVIAVTCPSVGHGVDDHGIAEGLKFVNKFLA